MFHRSERLFLRPAWPEDAEELFSGIADEGVVRNLARAPWPYDIEDARNFTARDFDAKFPVLLLTAPQASGDVQLVGCIGLDSSESDSCDAELGYWIARPYWGRGFATEAARAALQVAVMLGFQVIEAGHFLDNPASGKVLRKVGFKPTGKVTRRESLARGEAVPCADYRIDLSDVRLVSMAA